MNTVKHSFRSKASGVTLVELMVVVVIVGILTTIAVPSYRNYMLKANRVDAKAALLRLAAAEEKFYLQNNTYTTDLGALRVEGKSHNGHFNISVTQADGVTFTGLAAARDAQVQDTRCTTFTIDELGRKLGGPDSTTTVPECWDES